MILNMQDGAGYDFVTRDSYSRMAYTQMERAVREFIEIPSIRRFHAP